MMMILIVVSKKKGKRAEHFTINFCELAESETIHRIVLIKKI